MTADSGEAFPSQRTIAQMESGRRFFDNLEMAGAAHDTQTMNAAARVVIRKVHCGATSAASATCTYETNRCTTAENDADGDGWCVRTSKFVRVDNQRGIGDVLANGWGFDLE